MLTQHVLRSYTEQAAGAGFVALIRDRERNRTSPNRWKWNVVLSKAFHLLSNDIETHGASTISTPVMPWVMRRFATPSLTLYLYYTVTRHYCQVFSRLSFRSFSWKYFHCGLRDSSHSLFCSFVFMMMFFSLICDMHMTTWPTQAVSLVLSC